MVKRLEQFYPAFSGWDTVRGNWLQDVGAQRHIFKHQQRSDGKPASEPRMHAHTEHFLQLDREGGRDN